MAWPPWAGVCVLSSSNQSFLQDSQAEAAPQNPLLSPSSVPSQDPHPHLGQSYISSQDPHPHLGQSYISVSWPKQCPSDGRELATSSSPLVGLRATGCLGQGQAHSGPQSQPCWRAMGLMGVGESGHFLTSGTGHRQDVEMGSCVQLEVPPGCQDVGPRGQQNDSERDSETQGDPETGRNSGTHTQPSPVPRPGDEATYPHGLCFSLGLSDGCWGPHPKENPRPPPQVYFGG